MVFFCDNQKKYVYISIGNTIILGPNQAWTGLHLLENTILFLLFHKLMIIFKHGQICVYDKRTRCSKVICL